MEEITQLPATDSDQNMTPSELPLYSGPDPRPVIPPPPSPPLVNLKQSPLAVPVSGKALCPEFFGEAVDSQTACRSCLIIESPKSSHSKTPPTPPPPPPLLHPPNVPRLPM